MGSWIGTWWAHSANEGDRSGAGDGVAASDAPAQAAAPQSLDRSRRAPTAAGSVASVIPAGRRDGTVRPPVTVERRRSPRGEMAPPHHGDAGGESGEPWWAKPIQRPRQL